MNQATFPAMSQKRENELLSTAATRRDLLHQATEEINQFYDSIDDLPVRPDVEPETIRTYLEQFDFGQPADALGLVNEIADKMKTWSLHTPHPRYFGLFNPAPTDFGMVADLLTAGLNPQIGAWHHNPFAVEIEAHLIRYFAEQFGIGESAFGHFTGGGSEANFSAVVVALSRIFPSFAKTGARGLEGQPTLYCSTEFHHSFVKIAHQCGLGRNAVRLVPVTQQFVMDDAALGQMIDEDRKNGMLPFMVVATVGTTNAGLIEPMREIGDIAALKNLHLHVDAAWGGGVILSENHKSLLDGIEKADTITFDPQKMLSVPMGAGMFLVREHQWLREAFGLTTDYVPQSQTENLDNYQLSFQFSRRFIGLKLFMTLAAVGRKGLAKAIDRQLGLAKVLADKLERAGFRVVNGASLGVVCFVPPDEWCITRHAQLEALAERVRESGQAWISSTKLGGRSVLRACITSHLTRESDLDRLVALLNQCNETAVEKA
jgi:aromatic-L-amino-acid decarboxylase